MKQLPSKETVVEVGCFIHRAVCGR